MMKYLCFAILLLIAPLQGSAQDWKTVRLNDTTHFIAGMHNYMYGGNDSSLLRVIWIDSLTTMSADSVFYFYKTIRDTAFPQTSTSCIDTLSDTWLGNRFVRTAAGDEYYFNKFQDTILVKTRAAMGFTWIIATDRNNKVFHATITSVDTVMVDGVLDSVKTISLQGYKNGQPVSSIYDNKVLQISKHHGWLKALDFYAFPNNLPLQNNQIGAMVDMSQHERLPQIITPDLMTQFAPGSEWISDYSYGLPLTSVLTHDSVLMTTAIAADTVIVQLRRVTVLTDNKTNPATVTVNTIFISQTFYSNSTPVYTGLLPEYKFTVGIGASYLNFKPFLRSYLVQTFCNYFIVKHRTLLPYSFFNALGCANVMHSVSGFAFNDADTLQNFGQIGFSHEAGQAWFAPEGFSSRKTTFYIKMGNCSMGTKVNILPTGVSGPDGTAGHGLIPTPNPATQTFTLKGKGNSLMHVEIVDNTGRVAGRYVNVYPGQPLNISTLAPGVYILKISTSEFAYTRKLVKTSE